MDHHVLERARAAGDDRTCERLEPDVTTDYAPNPVGRLGRAEDLADAVAFLVSERAAYVTGAILRAVGSRARRTRCPRGRRASPS